MSRTLFASNATPSLPLLDANFTDLYDLRDLISTPAYTAATPRMAFDSSGNATLNFGLSVLGAFSTTASTGLGLCKAGTFSRTLSDVSGGIATTGVGFKPSTILFFGAVDTVPDHFIGVATPGGSRCLTSDASNNKLSSAHCIRLIRSSSGNEQQAVLASMDADGFTLTWTKVGSPPANSLIVNFLAFR